MKRVIIVLIFAAVIFFPLGPVRAEGEVFINEIAWMGNKTSANDEWMELKNNSSAPVSLDGWVLKNAGELEIVLKGEIIAGGFFLLERTDDQSVPDRTADLIYTGALANGGEALSLYGADGILIEEINFSASWPAGDNENKLTMERSTENGWMNSLVPDGTPGAENSVLSAPLFPEEISTAAPADVLAPASSVLSGGASGAIADSSLAGESSVIAGSREKVDVVFISEIFPNPVGADKEREFIELCNSGLAPANLKGWTLGDSSKAKFIFKEDKMISISECLAVYRSESRLALNNDGDKIRLFRSGEEKPFSEISYKKTKEGESFGLVGGDWFWSRTPTPGKENILIEDEREEEWLQADFVCPSEWPAGKPLFFDDVDMGGGEASYEWDFGDGFTSRLENPEHTFFQSGEFKISLVLKSGVYEARQEKTIKIAAGAETIVSEARSAGVSASRIIINEIMPDPEGDDQEGEWIELYNPTLTPALLSGLMIDDGEDGSKPYKLSEDEIIPAGGFYVLPRSASGLALNNLSDSARLFCDGEMLEEIKYEKTFSGQAYARAEEGGFAWTAEPTPGVRNAIKRQAETAAEEKRSDKKEGGFVSGLVIAGPGILSAQSFYIRADDEGAGGYPAVEIYNYKKDFPALAIGDYVAAAGEWSTGADNIPRLKTRAAADIKVLDHYDGPEAEAVGVSDLGASYAGRLVKIAGEITGKKGRNIYLDDGQGEALIYLKTASGLSVGSILIGDIVEASGIFLPADGGKIIPRRKEDLILKNKKEMPGEIASSSSFTIPEGERKNKKILKSLSLFGGIAFALSAVLAKVFFKG